MNSLTKGRTMKTLGLFVFALLTVALSAAQTNNQTAVRRNLDVPSCVVLCSECLWLDSYNSADTYDPGIPGSEVINTVSTSTILSTGDLYLIIISGTVSYWGSSYYTDPTGFPELEAMYDSPHAPQTGFVAADWEYLFAFPNRGHGDFLAGGALHEGAWANTSLDGGVTFLQFVPANFSAYSLAHTYQYLVTGRGAKAVFRLTDSGPHSDNHGRYKICIQRLAVCNTD